MADKVFVKPGIGADGQPFVIPNPATGRPLSADGEWVPNDRIARRRLHDRDWVEATPQSPAQSTATEGTSEP